MVLGAIGGIYCNTQHIGQIDRLMMMPAYSIDDQHLAPSYTASCYDCVMSCGTTSN